MKNNILPVILAGGSGSRLWPLSRELYPKQFLSLLTSSTMLQDTVARLDGISHDSPLFICNQEHRFVVAEQLRKNNIAHSGIILEPVGRNTASAIALAAFSSLNTGSDPLLLILPADHVIKGIAEFEKSISEALSLANSGYLVTFGITPTSPESGYGYIKVGESINEHSFEVSSFVEKPDIAKAKNYIDSGEYLWNSGMFLFKASSYLSELRKFRPEIFSACEGSIKNAHQDLDFIRLDESIFESCPNESIDCAVMENSSNVIVVSMDAQWNDIGSWSALWDVSKKDEFGNAIRGDVLIEDSNNSYIYSQSRLVTAVGVSEIIIIETKDAILVANKNKVQNVREIVKKLKESNRKEYLQHREVLRPWGQHDTIAEGIRYHVKAVTVKPGEKTATQLHYHRAEHWVVVSGTAKVTKGDEILLISENESVYIPVGVAHAVENPGKIPLELIEVRTGIYLEEDDVVRIEEYGVGY
uniref:mannose-1-phosphate guanylyltransferase n=1 Tax=Yersinia pseudotuberculosis TaxID=633 RepID=G4WJB2_YERPU|nr:mannose-1-phosphate guanylyltransferase [Yersinia pseudotuberculosis]